MLVMAPPERGPEMPWVEREVVAAEESERAKEPPWLRVPRTERMMRRDMEVVRTAAMDVTMVRMESASSVGRMMNQKRRLARLTRKMA
jgi:hypothetical protein